ncbi:MAG: efflux RND transporter permease subunit [Porticoccaceae bacterium]|nr:efflux RND transporter permease subunit [Porticoccaceae bacterium]
MNGLIAWFVKNPIAANLLMVLILIGGLINIPNLNREMFPERPPDSVAVTVPYPGAAPEEVEEQITLRLEEAVSDIDGVEEVSSVSSRGLAEVTVIAIPGYDPQKLLSDVKSRVDSVNSIPNEAERASVRHQLFRRSVIEIAVAAEMDEASLKLLGERVRDSLSTLPGADYVSVEGIRIGEISVEVSEQSLRRFNLTFAQVAAAIRRSSINQSAGQVRTAEGSVQLRATGQAYSIDDFEDIVVVQNPDGTRIKLGEVARVTDGFEDVRVKSRFNGKPAVFVEVFSTQDPDIIETANAVKERIDELRRELPPEVDVTIWRNRAAYLENRMNLLGGNALGGLALVFILLMLFLRPALAFWVAMGIGISYLGTLALMPVLGISINILSLFAFLLVLGIVVDDAIMVGESVHTHNERGIRNEAGAIAGAHSVLRPVSVAVITTLMVFGAMLLLPKQTMRLFTVVPLIALPALAISLMESFLILPCHLRHMKPETDPKNRFLLWFHNLRLSVARGMSWFASDKFGPFVAMAVRQRFTTIAVFFGVLAITLALFMGGWVKSSFWPRINGETVRGNILLVDGLAWDDVLGTARQIEGAVEKMRTETDFIASNGEPIVKNMRLRVRDNSINYRLEMLSVEHHNVSSRAVELRLKKLIGPLNNVEQFESRSTMGRWQTKDISFVVSGPDSGTLARAAAMLGQQMGRIVGVSEVEDTLREGAPEIQFTFKSGAESLGVGLSDVSRQLRQAFYGEEAQRIARLREDVKVMVHYPKAERQSLDSLNEFRVRTSDGRELPLQAVANVAYSKVPSSIVRNDRKRSITVSADLVDDALSTEEVTRQARDFFNEQIKPLYPTTAFDLDGAEKDRKEFEGAFNKVMLLVVLAIFGLIAILFHSYWQPLLVLSAVPFGLAGGIIGHMALGMQLSMMSLMGMLAAVGVVVNDNLVLIDRINQLRKEGQAAFESVVQAARDRFRPIVLTSITTFFGLMPILMEKSTQAKWLIPTVVSLSWGVVAATFVTLLLVPCLYLMGEDIKALFTGPKPSSTEKGATCDS